MNPSQMLADYVMQPDAMKWMGRTVMAIIWICFVAMNVYVLYEIFVKKEKRS